MLKSRTLIAGSVFITAAALVSGCGKGPISGEYLADCLTGIPQSYQNGTGIPGQTYSPTQPYYGTQLQTLSMKASMKFSGSDDVKGKLYTYSSNDCTGQVNSEIAIESKYTLGAAATPVAGVTDPLYNQGSLGAQTIDFTIKKIQVTRKSHEQVSASNSSRECSIVNWEINKKRDVSRTECSDDWWIAQTPFNVISIMGDRLYLGDANLGGGGQLGGGGKSTEQRVNVLSVTPYIKR